jgi:hypothetical protein
MDAQFCYPAVQHPARRDPIYLRVERQSKARKASAPLQSNRMSEYADRDGRAGWRLRLNNWDRLWTLDQMPAMRAKANLVAIFFFRGQNRLTNRSSTRCVSFELSYVVYCTPLQVV